MIKMVLKALGSNITIRKYDMDAGVYLGGFHVQHPEFNGQCLLSLPISKVVKIWMSQKTIDYWSFNKYL